MLWAVHISDGVLEVPWLLGGFVVAGILVLLSLWRVRDDEVPRIALLSAAFFIVSLIHVRVGPTSVHLLFNGLVGVLLGPRAALAIVVGLFLQFQYLAHGGILALGVNTCVLTLPALGAWLLFHLLHRLPALRTGWGKSLLVVAGFAIWMLSLIASISLVQSNAAGTLESLDLEPTLTRTFHPLTVAAALVAGVAAAILERRLENAPEFGIGLLIGTLTVLASVALNCAVLLWGIVEQSGVPRLVPLTLVVVHLPIAAIEGVILGFTLGFLAKVKPAMLARTG